MSRPYTWDLDQSGATADGQPIVWDSATSRYKPRTTALYADPLTTKGDLLGRSLSATGRVPVGTDGYALTADAASTFGVKWTDLNGLFIPKSLVDAKGDLLVGTADNTVARKAVGADGTILTADSTQTDGLKWGSALTDPTTTKGDILTRTSSSLVRRAVGSDGQVLTADSTQTDGVKWATPSAGSNGMRKLADAAHNPGTFTETSSTSNGLTPALTAVDATNLAVTFTPTGTEVWVHQEAMTLITNTGNNVYWGLLDGSSAVVSGSVIFACNQLAYIRVSSWRKITVSAGVSTTFKFGLASQGTQTAKVGRGGGNGPAILAVFEF